MSAILRRDRAGIVQPFEHDPRPVGPVVPRPDPRDLECERLAARIAELEAAIEAAENAGGKAIAAARAEGERAGLARAEAREEERIAALRDGIGGALTAWQTRLDGLDVLAAQLAEAALAKLFEPHADLAEAVGRRLGREIRALRKASIVTIHVSPRDFADPAARAAVAGAIADEGGAVTVETDPELDTGACRITCRMEQYDLDVRADWAAIRTLLTALGTADA